MKTSVKSVSVVIILAVLVVLNFQQNSSSSSDTLSSGDVKNEIRTLRAKRDMKCKQALNERSKLAVVKENKDYFWLKTGSKSVTSLTIRNIVQQLGRRSGVTLSNVGSPRESTFSDNIGSYQVTISSRSVSIKDVAKFLKIVDANRPAFFWSRLELRPDRRNPGKVDLSGSLTTYFLSKPATKLFAKPGRSQNVKRGIK